MKKKSSEHKEHSTHSKKNSKIKSKNSAYTVIGVLAAVIVIVVVLALVLTRAPVKTGTVNVDMYVMSQCPYGVQAEDAMIPALQTLGDSANFNLYFIGGTLPDGSFQSLHGDNEVNGDIAQLCAIKYEPDKYRDLILCMNKDAGSIPNNWESCAAQLSLNKDSIKTCYEGTEGKQLLAESFDSSDKAGAQGSPTIKINGNDYSGQRDTLSFTRAMCQYVDSPACSSIPLCTQDSDCAPKEGKIPSCENAGTQQASCSYRDDAKVQLTVVNDNSCAECDATQIIGALKQIFLNMDVKTVDISTAEGKKMIEDYGLDVVPAFIFDSSVEQAYIWSANPNVQTIFEKINGHYKILDDATGATHYVSEEKRQEVLDKIGVTLGDNKPQVDFFVMSYCPYGNQAEETIEQVYEEIGNSSEFNPHYVIYSNYGGAANCLDSEQKYCSLHGLTELNQDVREMCVNEHYGTAKWFDFAVAMNSKCDVTNADTCWENVASGLGLDTQQISDCEKNEATALLENEKELNDLLGVKGSPTIFIEGQQYSGSRDANSILSAMCSAFDSQKPAECSNTIAASSGTTAAASSGACG